jgi:hypothetical protein
LFAPHVAFKTPSWLYTWFVPVEFFMRFFPEPSLYVLGRFTQGPFGPIEYRGSREILLLGCVLVLDVPHLEGFTGSLECQIS